MQVEKLKELDKLHHAGENAKVKLVDGLIVICQPWGWSEEEEGIAYDVLVIDSGGKYPKDTYLTLENDYIASVSNA